MVEYIVAVALLSACQGNPASIPENALACIATPPGTQSSWFEGGAGAYAVTVDGQRLPLEPICIRNDGPAAAWALLRIRGGKFVVEMEPGQTPCHQPPCDGPCIPQS